MESTVKRFGTVKEMKELFDNANKFSVRHYKALTDDEISDADLGKTFKFEICIRHSDELEKQIIEAKKVSGLLKLNDGAITNDDEKMADSNILTKECVQCRDVDFEYNGYVCDSCLKNQRENDFRDGIITITKDNVHLYYEFMSDEDKQRNIFILNGLFTDRFIEVARNLTVKLTEINYYMIECGISYSIFGVKDTLKPIDKYITEIKASEEYKAYIINSIDFDTKKISDAVKLYQVNCESFLLENFEEFSLTDIENSTYTSNDMVDYDLRDYLNITGFDIEYEVVNDVHIVNMLDVKKVLG